MKTSVTRMLAITGLSLTVAIVGISFWRSKSWRWSAGSGNVGAASAKPPLAEFVIGKGQRLILLPVTIKGQEVLFLVDTGAWRSAADRSLMPLLGRPMGRTTITTSAGSFDADLFAWPDASVGNVKITGLDSIFCHDFTPFRYASGKEIYGTLGIDFLKKYAIEIDFDDGKLRLWDHAPEDWHKNGHSMRISYDESNRPHIEAVAGTGTLEQFQVDTGANGSTLREVLFDSLCQHGDLQVGRDYNALAGGGSFRGKTGYLNRLKVQQFAHEQLRFDRDRFSLLGLSYLSRYTVRLDFPKDRAYFEKGKRFDVAESSATSGMSILQINGEKVVRVVEPGGPAASQRISPGDVIVAVNGNAASEYDMVALREVLTQKPGATVPLQLRRNGQEFSATIELQSRLVR